jgi:hypothetical protein
MRTAAEKFKRTRRASIFWCYVFSLQTTAQFQSRHCVNSSSLQDEYWPNMHFGSPDSSGLLVFEWKKSWIWTDFELWEIVRVFCKFGTVNMDKMDWFLDQIVNFKSKKWWRLLYVNYGNGFTYKHWCLVDNSSPAKNSVKCLSEVSYWATHVLVLIVWGIIF